MSSDLRTKRGTSLLQDDVPSCHTEKYGKQRTDWRVVDRKLLEVALMPRGEVVRAMRAISETHKLHLATLYRRLDFIGAHRIEARMGPRALALWEKRHRTIARGFHSNMRLIKSIGKRYEWVAAEIRETEARTYTDAQVAHFLGVGRQWVRFVESLGYLPISKRTKNAQLGNSGLTGTCR